MLVLYNSPLALAFILFLPLTTQPALLLLQVLSCQLALQCRILEALVWIERVHSLLTGANIFVLLGCSTTSPVFDPSEDLCDTGSGSRVCSGLYSCKGVTGIGLPQNAPTSTCCVYDSLMGVGSGYSLDLPKLQCSSYTSIYEFGDEGDPMKWKFGISLQYNDSYYTPACKNCETSGGLCGFAGLDQSFSCLCRDGVNTTTNCFGHG